MLRARPGSNMAAEEDIQRIELNTKLVKVNKEKYSRKRKIVMMIIRRECCNCLCSQLREKDSLCLSVKCQFCAFQVCVFLNKSNFFLKISDETLTKISHF